MKTPLQEQLSTWMKRNINIKELGAANILFIR